MFSLKITSIDKLDVQADNNTVLDVQFDILKDDGSTEETRRLSFPLDTTPEQLQEQLKDFLVSYQNDKDLETQNAGLNAAHAQADETIAALNGTEITLSGTSSEASQAEATTTEETTPTEAATEATNEAPADTATESQPTTETPTDQPATDAAPTEGEQPTE